MHLDCLINCLYTRSCAPPPACLQHGSRDASRVACNSDTSPAALPSFVHTMQRFNLQSDQRLCADGPCADMPTDKYTNLMFHCVQCYCVLWNTNIYFRVNSFMSFDTILNQTISTLYLINFAVNEFISKMEVVEVVVEIFCVLLVFLMCATFRLY